MIMMNPIAFAFPLGLPLSTYPHRQPFLQTPLPPPNVFYHTRRLPFLYFPRMSDQTPAEQQPTQAPSPSPTSTTSQQIDQAAITSAAATLVLQRAATAYTDPSFGHRRPPAATVLSSLSLLESTQRKYKARVNPKHILGQWRVVFTGRTQGGGLFTRGGYFPVRAYATFVQHGKDNDGDEMKGVFDNSVFIGGASLRFRGPFRWIGERNRSEFTFEELLFQFGSWAPVWKWTGLNKGNGFLNGVTNKTPPFFTFFYVRKGIACARGRSGGVALYKKVEKGDEV